MHYHIQSFDPKAKIWKSYKVAIWGINENIATLKYKIKNKTPDPEVKHRF